MIRVIGNSLYVIPFLFTFLFNFHFSIASVEIPQNLIFEKIFLSDKIPFGIVEDIAQDKYGFIWIGAKDGLYRFDGKNFKGYFYDRGDSASLSSNVVRDIFVDIKGNMWIGTEHGLNLYDPLTDRFKRFFNVPETKNCLAGDNVREMISDKDGNIWIATFGGGVCKYDIHSGEFILLGDLLNSEDTPSHTRTIYCDPNGTFWLGAVNGIFTFDLQKLKLRHLKTGIQGTEPDVRCIVTDKNGTTWIGTSNSGIICHDSTDKIVKCYNKNLDGKQKISSNTIWNLYIDSKEILWACTDGGGLLRYNPASSTFLPYTLSDNDPTCISSNVVRSFFEDKAGNYWIGNFNAPLNYINNHRKEFHLVRNFDQKNSSPDQNKITSVFLDSQDRLWLCTDGSGVYIKDNKTGEYANIKLFAGKNRMLNNKPISIAEDSNGDIWMGLYEGGLSCIRKSDGRIINFYPDGTTRNPKSSQIWNLLIAGDSIWIAGQEGIETYNKKNGSFNHYPLPEYNEIVYSAWAVLNVSDKKIWIGTMNGVFIYNAELNTVEHLISDEKNLNTLSDSWVFTLCQDPKGRIWVGTNGGGLNLWKGGNNFACFTQKDGLSGNVINNIQYDNSGNLWISTNHGLTKFNYEASAFKNYNIDDGLQDNRFNINSGFKDKNGFLYFGGVNGLSWFHPARIEDNKFIPPLVFTELEVFKEPSKGKDSKVPLKKNILEQGVIHIYPGQSVFTIYFAALNYSHPDRNQYKYKLNEFDSYWNDIGNQNWATFSGLKPGKYSMSVIAANNDYVWNVQPKTLQIIVHPPFYRSNFFIILLVVLLAGSIFVIYRMRVKNIRIINEKLSDLVAERTRELELRNSEVEQQNEEIIRQRDIANAQRDQIINQNRELEEHRSRLEELVEERTRDLVREKENAEASDKIKTVFLENLSYQIRTPMNAIIGFVNLLSEKIDDTVSRDYYMKIIRESGKSMLRLIEDIIDFSQMQTGQLKPDLSECNASELIRQLVSASRERASREKPSLSIIAELPGKDLIMFTDEKKLNQIFSKLIDNSMKFTEKGFIKIGIAGSDNESVLFFVEDSGVGIEKKYIDKIFDRFFSVDDNIQNYRGSGLGLAFAKLATEILNGAIWAESILAEGSKFFFRIPFRQVPATSGQLTGQVQKKYSWPGKTIIVAEDEDSNYLLIEAILKDTGVHVVRALNGVEFLEKMNENVTYDLVLLDLKMPRMGGVHAMRILRESSNTIPIIVQTAYDQADQREQCRELGCNEFLVKPLKKKDVLEVMNKYLG